MLSIQTSGMLQSSMDNIKEESAIHYSPNGLKKRYFLIKQIAEGAEGLVVLGVPILESSENSLALTQRREVAIKIINKSGLNPVQMERVHVECNRMKRMSHPHIIPFIEALEDEEHFYVVMEFVPGVDFLAHVEKRQQERRGKIPCVPEQELRVVFRQVGEALHYLHSIDLFHRDVKPSNILYDTRRQHAYLCDFGLSSYIGAERGKRNRQPCGTASFIAPEVVSGQPYLGPELDVWSLGVSLLSVAIGRSPFDGKDLRETLALVSKGVFKLTKDEKKGLSPSLLDLLNSMIDKDPVSRATIGEVLDHPWMMATNAEESSSLSSPSSSLALAENDDRVQKEDSGDSNYPPRRRLSSMIRRRVPLLRRESGSSSGLARSGGGSGSDSGSGKPKKTPVLDLDAHHALANMRFLLLDTGVVHSLQKSDFIASVEENAFHEKDLPFRSLVSPQLRTKLGVVDWDDEAELLFFEADGGPRISTVAKLMAVLAKAAAATKAVTEAAYACPIEARLLPAATMRRPSDGSSFAKAQLAFNEACAGDVDGIDGVIAALLDAKARLWELSGAFCRAVGWSNEDLLGRSLSAIVHRDMVHAAASLVAHAASEAQDEKKARRRAVVVVHRVGAHLPMWAEARWLPGGFVLYRLSALLHTSGQEQMLESRHGQGGVDEADLEQLPEEEEPDEKEKGPTNALSVSTASFDLGRRQKPWTWQALQDFLKKEEEGPLAVLDAVGTVRIANDAAIAQLLLRPGLHLCSILTGDSAIRFSDRLLELAMGSGGHGGDGPICGGMKQLRLASNSLQLTIADFFEINPVTKNDDAPHVLSEVSLAKISVTDILCDGTQMFLIQIIKF